MNNFRNEILKVNVPRKHKINNSLGVYDSYKYIRKNKWFGIGKALSEHEFYTIIRSVNNYLADNLSNGKDIKLPCRMGSLELRKRESRAFFKKGVLNTSSFPIDWDKTLKLWSEDSESHKNKALVRMEEKEVFRVFFNKKKATFNNKSFYEFKVNRDLKKKLKQNIKNGTVDAFKLYG